MPATFTVQWPDWSRFDAGLKALSEFDARPLMERWADIIVEGNRRGVLAGLDGNDRPMPPLRYRGGAGKKTANRRVPAYGTTRHASTGYGPYSTGLHDNLTTAQYLELTGPRLAPRRERSRVIKNLHTEIRSDPPAGTWEVVGAWAEVVSVKGVRFLSYHFNGTGRLPRYDLRPIRPKDREFALNALRAFVRGLFLVRF